MSATRREGAPRGRGRAGAVPGIDRGRVTAWMVENIDAAVPPLRFEPIPGGNSNLTYRVTGTDGAEFALRRPPLGHALATAHDVGREYRIISALDGAGVPVPPALGLCRDPDVNGAPFYVMGFVAGLVPHDRTAGSSIPSAERESLGEDSVSVLATLHSLDPDRIGLGDLGRRDEYVRRQLRTWSRQWEASKQRDLPTMDRVRALLENRIPIQQRAGVVHGDYRFGNLIVKEGKIKAVVDWELCTLGDPLADLGYLANDWIDPGGPELWRSSMVQDGGFPSSDEMAARYANLTGADVSGLPYYRAMQAWRLAAILEGVYARYRHGVMDNISGVDLRSLAGSVERLADFALECLEGGAGLPP